MREIKFRGINPSNGKFRYGDLVFRGIHAYILGNNHREIECENEVLIDTVGQFTGLKDCNGAEIYEGDILVVLINNTMAEAEVKFVDGCFIVQHITHERLSAELNRVNLLYEVIGNIYES